MIPHDARLPDPARSRLRAAVAAVESAMPHPAKVATTEAAAPGALAAAWHELVELLAVGPEPEYRVCPECGGVGMSTATVCGYCWTKLTPLEGKPCAS